MASHDVDYYRTRAEQERARAETSVDPAAAKIHRSLAELYENRLNGGDLPPRWTSN